MRFDPNYNTLSTESVSGTYIDRIVLSDVTNENIGVYNVKAIIENTEYSFNIEYDFTITVRPCQMTEILKADDQTIEYNINDEGITTESYSFE